MAGYCLVATFKYRSFRTHPLCLSDMDAATAFICDTLCRKTWSKHDSLLFVFICTDHVLLIALIHLVHQCFAAQRDWAISADNEFTGSPTFSAQHEANFHSKKQSFLHLLCRSRVCLQIECLLHYTFCYVFKI